MGEIEEAPGSVKATFTIEDEDREELEGYVHERNGGFLSNFLQSTTWRVRIIWLVFISALITVLVFIVAVIIQRGHKREVEAKMIPRSFKPTVILISLDGFRSDYLEEYEEYSPNIHSLIQTGVRAEYMIPVFPTKTFPNHYSIVTGLYAESHGIIGNSMWDPITQKSFSIYDSNSVRDSSWWLGEPLWVTAVLQNQTSATCSWPGSEARIKGLRPNYTIIYDPLMSNDEKVDTIIEWLQHPVSKRPTFITSYFSQVDSSGHQAGPENITVMKEAIRSVDDAIGNLMSRLESIGILQEVNIVITSDHGMANVSSSRVILVDNYVDMNDIVRVVDSSPLFAIYPKEGKEETLKNQLNSAHPEMKAYLKDEIPDRWHYKYNPRVTPIIAVANEGWSISTSSRFHSNEDYYNGGDHGYDNKNHQMRSIFIANGPDFARGKVIQAFENVNIYPTICRILGLIPASNNGSVITQALA